MANLGYGSSGSDVKELQDALIAAGYDVGSTGADGIFGAKTQAAVKQYQRDNGLSVDGIAGVQTKGSLYSKDTSKSDDSSDTTSSDTTSSDTTSSGGNSNTGSYTGTSWSKYFEQQNPEIAELKEQLKSLTDQINQPVDYQDGWGEETYKALLQQAVDMNYDDWTKGEQYQSLATRYGDRGKMSMQDVLGQIASRTGGLASSYATTAAHQQYNDWMAQLEEVARATFVDERGTLIENADLAKEYGEQEYGRYIDELNQKRQGQSYALDTIMQLLGYAYQDDETRYDRYIDQLQQIAASRSSGSSGGSSGGGGGGYDNGGLTSAQVKALQREINRYRPADQQIAVDGKWGAETSAAVGGATADQYYEAALPTIRDKNIQSSTSAYWTTR